VTERPAKLLCGSTRSAKHVNTNTMIEPLEIPEISSDRAKDRVRSQIFPCVLNWLNVTCLLPASDMFGPICFLLEHVRACVPPQEPRH